MEDSFHSSRRFLSLRERVSLSGSVTPVPPHEPTLHRRISRRCCREPELQTVQSRLPGKTDDLPSQVPILSPSLHMPSSLWETHRAVQKEFLSERFPNCFVSHPSLF